MFAEMPHDPTRSLLVSTSHDGTVLVWDWLRALTSCDGRVEPLARLAADVGPIIAASLVQVDAFLVCAKRGRWRGCCMWYDMVRIFGGENLVHEEGPVVAMEYGMTL